jgi:hypothetical protein
MRGRRDLQDLLNLAWSGGNRDENGWALGQMTLDKTFCETRLHSTGNVLQKQVADKIL